MTVEKKIVRRSLKSSFLVLIVCSNFLFSADSRFRLVGPISTYSRSQQRYLGIFPSSNGGNTVSDWIRCGNPKFPGDYFQFPEGADSTEFIGDELAEIIGLLSENVVEDYYDQFVVEKLAAYQYSIADSSVTRREYYVKYACGDTIFAISGWLGKFFSFYKLVPGDFRYNVEDLQIEVSKISPSYRIVKGESFTYLGDEYNYLLEYIERASKMRIRNYQIDGRFRYGVTSKMVKKYNLIEITKFIDPEVMP